MMDIDMETGEHVLNMQLKKTKLARRTKVASASYDMSKQKMRVSKEDKKNVYYMSKALDAMGPTERLNLLNALNIDQ